MNAEKITNRRTDLDDMVGLWTRRQIRDAAYEFCGHNPRTGRTAIGPVWCALGSTPREAMITHAVWTKLIHVAMADDRARRAEFSVHDLREVRKAFEAECAAIGIEVHS